MPFKVPPESRQAATREKGIIFHCQGLVKIGFHDGSQLAWHQALKGEQMAEKCRPPFCCNEQQQFPELQVGQLVIRILNLLKKPGGVVGL